MLEKHDWDGFAKRVLHSIETGRRELYDHVYEVPVESYLDAGRWLRETDVVFRRQPVVLAFSCELAEPNSYRALERAGVPILLTRSSDGVVRGFINKCRHRGALITGEAEQCGVASRFACPYHAWTFDNKGKLVGVPGKSEFGEIGSEYQTLVAIRVEERAGLIWGVLTPGEELNLDSFLGPMLPMIAKSGFEAYHLAGRGEIAGPNWKVAMDGYLENYHFQALHKTTFAEFLWHDHAIYDDAGPHCRFFFVHPQVGDLRDRPEAEWKAHNLLQLGYFVFPNLVGAHKQDEDPTEQPFLFFQIWPSDRVDRSMTYLTVVSPVPRSSPEEQRITDEFVQMILDVIRREDYWVGHGIQRGLDAVGGGNFLFGRMERLCQLYHKRLAALVE